MDSEQFVEIMSGISRVETEQQSLRRELLGNGQPGRIQKIELDFENIRIRQGALEKSAAVTVWKLGTLSAVAGASLTVTAQWLAKHLFHF